MKQMTDTAGTNPLPIKERLQQRLLDQVDLQQLFKVSRGTIYNWRRRGLLSFTQLGGKMYFDALELEKMIVKNKRTYEPERRRRTNKK